MSDAVVFMHFKKFTNKLGELLQALSKKQISDFDSREIELKLFDWKLKLYEDIQIILHIISVAATKSSCESRIESYWQIISKRDKDINLYSDSYFRSQKKQKQYWHFFL